MNRRRFRPGFCAAVVLQALCAWAAASHAAAQGHVAQGARAQEGGAPAGPIAATGGAAPLVTPLADVDVSYDVFAPTGGRLGQRMRWRSDGWLQRIDPTDSATFMISDYRAGQLSVVDTAHRTVSAMDVPLAQFAPPGQPAPGAWVMGGGEQVASQACTEWTGRDSDGNETTFCYTADGVLLKASRGGAVFLQASRVLHEPQGRNLFAVPGDFRRIAAAPAP